MSLSSFENPNLGISFISFALAQLVLITMGHGSSLESCYSWELFSPMIHSGNDPAPIELDPPTFPDGSRSQIPIAVMASNRPHYLLRMLRGLQKVAGLNPSMVTVFIDGFWKEPASVTRLMGIKLQQHAGVSSKNARIAQVNHARVKSKRSAVVLMINLWRINP